jgi:hypothetical protein
MALNEVRLDAPIPGMSMLHEVGARPWQTPPELTTVDETVDYYLERMSSDEFLEQLEDILEMGIPVTNVANVLQLGGVMEGIHTVDMGMLVLPVIVEMMMLVGDSAGIEYDSGLDKQAEMNQKRTRNTLVAKTARKLQMELNEKKKNKDIDTEETVEPEVEEPVEPKQESGLMSRRAK